MVLKFQILLDFGPQQIFSRLRCIAVPGLVRSFSAKVSGAGHMAHTTPENKPFCMSQIRTIVWIQGTYGQDVWSNCLQEFVGISTNPKKHSCNAMDILGIHSCSRLIFRWWALDFWEEQHHCISLVNDETQLPTQVPEQSQIMVVEMPSNCGWYRQQLFYRWDMDRIGSCCCLSITPNIIFMMARYFTI